MTSMTEKSKYKPKKLNKKHWSIILFIIIIIISCKTALWVTQWVTEPQKFEEIEAPIFYFGNSSIIMNCVIWPEECKVYPRLDIPNIAVAGDNLLCKLNYSDISKEFDKGLFLNMEIRLYNEKLGFIDNTTLNFSEKEQFITLRLKGSGKTYFGIFGAYIFHPASGISYSEDFGRYQTPFYVYKSSDEFIKLKEEYELKRKQIMVIGFIGILGSLLAIFSFLQRNFLD